MLPKGPTTADILNAPSMRGLRTPVNYPKSDTADYVQALDRFCQVFAIRPGEHVVMLTDPNLDPRILQGVVGLARSRGATFESYMGESTQLMAVPDRAKAILERANFVVSTWYCSVNDPFCIALRRDKGQRWVKITYFRNWDLLNTPQARFPADLLQ